MIKIKNSTLLMFLSTRMTLTFKLAINVLSLIYETMHFNSTMELSKADSVRIDNRLFAIRTYKIYLVVVCFTIKF